MRLMSHNKLGSPNLRGSLRGKQRVHVSVYVWPRGSVGGCRGGPAWAEADAPAFLALGPRRVAHTGPPSLLVTGRTPVTLRNSAPGLPCRLSGEEPTCQRWRHRLLPWPGRIPRASEQLSRTPPRTKPALQSREPHLLEAPGPGAPAPQQERPRTPPAARAEPKQQRRPSMARASKYNHVQKEALRRPAQGRLASHPGSRRPGRRTHETNRDVNP